jgi:hypothetical protein
MRPDGALVAMVGGRDYDQSQFNRKRAKARPGASEQNKTPHYAGFCLSALSSNGGLGGWGIVARPRLSELVVLACPEVRPSRAWGC